MIEIELSDPDAKVSVTVDQDRVDVAGLNEPLSLEVGEHALVARGPGYETVTKLFKVTRGKNAPLTVSLVSSRKDLPDKHAPRPTQNQREPLVAASPFNAEQARSRQASWAQRLGTPIEQENSIGMRLVLIPPGEFTMGSTPEQIEEAKRFTEQLGQKLDSWMLSRLEDELPAHRVTISQPFLIGATEVTIGQFRRFVNSAGYVTEGEQFGGGNSDSINENDPEKKQLTWQAPGFAVAEDSNVSQVTRNDAIAFCNWLSETEKLSPCYRKDARGDMRLVDSGLGYRLPTEAEWEYACRAGSTTQFSFGDDPTEFPGYGWSRKFGRIPRPLAVATKLPNGFGLYDMHGNVFEWCHDWYARDYYSHSPATDPRGAPSGEAVRRSGQHGGLPLLYCRSSFRALCSPYTRSDDLGFRLVRILTNPQTVDDGH
jgi:formylglycine-generating enzyme required for sulfatase activity